MFIVVAIVCLVECKKRQKSNGTKNSFAIGSNKKTYVRFL